MCAEMQSLRRALGSCIGDTYYQSYYFMCLCDFSILKYLCKRNILSRRSAEEWKNRFYIVFEGEEGQDAGGLLREW